MQGDTPRHEEFTPLALWARALTWGAVAIGLRAVFVNPPGEGVFPSFVAAGILSLGILVEAVFGGLRVRLYTDRIEVSLGRVGWIRKTIRYETIERLDPVTYRPLKEFGGWGVRGFGDKQAWTARGDRALVLHLVGGARIYVGSEHPEQLAERMRSAGNRRWDTVGRA
ncbi:hypothetical protein [Gaopeijia maritima]|uniref:PH domain-containing protein n=1 Tax=Gaopeijia maritima TaxID=3119007 RepID=A0ABU9E4P6_9BACT